LREPITSDKRLSSVVICCGGGTDSTALVAYYLDRGFDVRCVHFDYGQPSFPGERQAVSAISKYYHVPVRYSELRPKLVIKPNTECPGRNALFVLVAAQFLEHGIGLISLGIHSGMPYYDCTPTFVHQMQHLLDGYFGGAVVLDVPFLHFHKQDIYDYCREHGVPVHLTYSCEQNPNTPCGECLSCLDRRQYDLSP
jgi:7-cyano-7-deazaguanine synthase